jgi:tRNA(Ile)-lysidine synthase
MMETVRQCGADRVVVGHTADDQAETVLLWILRGAGLTGLSGMPACRDGVIIRPLYETRRKDVHAYLHDEGVPFRRDSSNDTPVYLRNRVRHEIIPVLQRVAPSAVEVLCRLADICGEDDRYLDKQVAALCAPQIRRLPEGGWSIDRSFLRQLPHAAQRRVVRNLWRQSHAQHQPPSTRSVERLLQIVAGRMPASDIAVSSAGVTVERNCVRFAPSNLQKADCNRTSLTGPTVLTVPGQIIWEGTGQRIQARQLTRKLIQEAGGDRNKIVVDADRIPDALVVRAWKPGDRFCPLGMNGRSKKLQDFFTDLKVPGEDRTRIPVVVAPEGIVWIVGYRQDDRWSVNEATERCVVLTVQDQYAAKEN